MAVFSLRLTGTSASICRSAGLQRSKQPRMRMPPQGWRTARGVAVGVPHRESVVPCSGGRDWNPETGKTVVRRTDGKTELRVRRFLTGLDADGCDPVGVCVFSH